MPVRDSANLGPFAMSRPAVSRPTMPARMAAAVMRIPYRDHFGMGVWGCSLSVLLSRVRACPSLAMEAGNRTEHG